MNFSEATKKDAVISPDEFYELLTKACCGNPVRQEGSIIAFGMGGPVMIKQARCGSCSAMWPDL